MNAAFSKALFDTDPDLPADIANVGNRFNVYRNNYIVGLVGALTSSYPVVHQLVGQEYFECLARDFAVRKPPKTPILALYGGEFASFLEAFDPLRDLPYLPDVARVEWARQVALNADLGPTFKIENEADLEQALEMAVRLTPGATLLQSHYPVGTIWQRHQAETVEPISQWVPENVVVWPLHGQVQQQTISENQASVLSAIDGGETIMKALDDVVDEAHAIQLIGIFTAFVNLGLLVPLVPDFGE